MKAMLLDAPGAALRLADIAIPEPGPKQVRVKVAACGVCRTDLHVADGDLTDPKLPIVPGHEIVGRVDKTGPGVIRFAIGQRVGIPWLGHTCGSCRYCRDGRENLCDHPGFTGYQIDGGYAEYAVVDADYCFPLPEGLGDVEAAPLLCAGLIGYRTLRMAGPVKTLGIYGFGAAAHIVAQVARHQGMEAYAFTRPGDTAAQVFACELGCVWAGGSDERPPQPLDAALVFAPVGGLVPLALEAVRKGGVVVLGGIHMSEIPAMPYALLWEERVIRSVANLTRRDAEEFLALAPRVPVRTHTTALPLAKANEALDRLRRGELTGALVLVP
ncbi:zinc-dependent alcohol dehydrogenase family protein [Hyphomicrobium sp. LHD-15]|uniref:zinc-dependent alcohol dehydrogenase family protein n=1 Tax=Hyphomicrobium sp. LHD-15 TaxID=3072142 RepID=UPI00280CBACB|nr:zinc-dependent alcohol dehydrogenase family protein [Hyphomicrobium sp. LHD-15]MDQ8700286.1 zinc-dependent alcohol dehydrogenase family protein [Hyphomicrobium sp. LHD-15]